MASRASDAASPHLLKRKPPILSSGPRDLQTPKNVSPHDGHGLPVLTRPKGDPEAVKLECIYLINHEFRALQLDKQMATMSVFDLIDRCASLFEKSNIQKQHDMRELFRLYVRSFLIFNYFVNTFIMLHFNGFARFMESSHQDFIIYLNLYNFYRCDDIVGPYAFATPLKLVREWTIEYLTSKKLLTFDVSLLYKWLDEYIEYLKKKEGPITRCLQQNSGPLTVNTSEPRNITVNAGQNDDMQENLITLETSVEDDVSDFNTRFPEVLPASKSPNLRHSVQDAAAVDLPLPKQTPYPVSSVFQPETSALPYPVEQPALLYTRARPPNPLPSFASLENSENTQNYSPEITRPQSFVELPPDRGFGFWRSPNMQTNFPMNVNGVSDYHLPQGSAGVHIASHMNGSINGHFNGQPNLPVAPVPRYTNSNIVNSNGVGFERAATTSTLYRDPYILAPPQIQQQHQNYPKEGIKKAASICGLKNLGSSCYINLTVQVLVGLETFEASLLGQANLKPLTAATVGLISTFNANGGANIAPTKFLRVLSSMKPDFNVPFEQQDAQEFLLFLLDKLHEEMAVKLRDYSVDYLRKWNITVNPRDKDDYLKWYHGLLNHEGESAINDTFQGHVQSKLVCNKCGHRSVSYSPFTILSLPIPAGNSQTVDLTDCLRYYTQDEVLTGENAWNCPKCSKTPLRDNPMDVVFQPKRGLFRLKRSKSPPKKNAGNFGGAHVTPSSQTSISLKQLSFIKLPPVMFIHLSRFSMAGVTDKLNTNISYPLRLTFNHQTHDICYSLTGLINHYGTLKSGHYTSLVNKARATNSKTNASKDSLVEPLWCFFDDDSVRINVAHGNVHSQDYNKLHSRDVYVLCYERV